MENPKQACDKYQHLVVGPDGQTVSNPFGLLPTMGDYEEWRVVALHLIEMAEAELDRLFEAHGAINEAYVHRIQAIRERWVELGSSPVFALVSPAIVQMVQVAQDAACAIGQTEAVNIELGGMPANIPSAPANGNGSSSKGASSSKGGGKGMGLGLVLLLGAWAMTRD